MPLKPGTRLRSATDLTEVVVVRAPAEPVDVRCGGAPMILIDADQEDKLPIREGFGGGTQLGKRYGGEDVGLELLCTKAGEASLSIGDEPLALKGSKALPSSD